MNSVFWGQISSAVCKNTNDLMSLMLVETELQEDADSSEVKAYSCMMVTATFLYTININCQHLKYAVMKMARKGQMCLKRLAALVIFSLLTFKPVLILEICPWAHSSCILGLFNCLFVGTLTRFIHSDKQIVRNTEFDLKKTLFDLSKHI